MEPLQQGQTLNRAAPQHQPRTIAFVTNTREFRSGAVTRALDALGFTTVERSHDTGTERLVGGFQPDLTVLAITPSHAEDIEVVRAVRRSSSAPLVVLGPGSSALGFSEAFDAGADICAREGDGATAFLAQLGAIARRAVRPAEAEPHTLEVRDITLDFDRCEASRDGALMPLTPTEFKILALLARQAGKVVAPVEILREAQGFSYGEHEAQQVVKVYIRRIRSKLEPVPDVPTYLLNVRGFGYLLERRDAPAQLRRAA